MLLRALVTCPSSSLKRWRELVSTRLRVSFSAFSSESTLWVRLRTDVVPELRELAVALRAVVLRAVDLRAVVLAPVVLRVVALRAVVRAPLLPLAVLRLADLRAAGDISLLRYRGRWGCLFHTTDNNATVQVTQVLRVKARGRSARQAQGRRSRRVHRVRGSAAPSRRTSARAAERNRMRCIRGTPCETSGCR
jgi:hypothetical protein